MFNKETTKFEFESYGLAKSFKNEPRLNRKYFQMSIVKPQSNAEVIVFAIVTKWKKTKETTKFEFESYGLAKIFKNEPVLSRGHF